MYISQRHAAYTTDFGNSRPWPLVYVFDYIGYIIICSYFEPQHRTKITFLRQTKKMMRSEIV